MIKASHRFADKVTAIQHDLLRFLDGDHAGAFFISQLLYYQRHGMTYNDAELGEGWRIMQPDDWYSETFCSKRQIEKRVKDYPFLESVNKKSPYDKHSYSSGKGRKNFNWYRINLELFDEMYTAWESEQNVQPYDSNKMSQSDSNKMSQSDDSNKMSQSLIRDNKNETVDIQTDDKNEDQQAIAIVQLLRQHKIVATIQQAFKILDALQLNEVDMSELPNLIEWLDDNRTGQYQWVSIHSLVPILTNGVTTSHKLKICHPGGN